MAHELADETLELILEYALKVPDEDFRDVSGVQSSLLTQRRYANSAVLLVCKRWMRIATPLLYDAVILRSTAQAQALSKALMKVPECAPFLKRLRLEGGFGAPVGKILRAATHLRDLHISLHFKSKDNIKAMCEALPAVNPSRLILSGPPTGSNMNINMKTVLGSIQASARSWTNLTTVVVSYDALLKTEVTDAVLAMPTIRAFHLNGFIYTISRLDGVLQRWPDCKVHIQYEDIKTYDKEFTEAYLAKHTKQLVVHRSDYENSVAC